MLQKGFIAIVNKLQIHAMHIAGDGEVQANQSDAQFFHVYRKEPSGDLTLVERQLPFDTAFDLCLTPATLH